MGKVSVTVRLDEELVKAIDDHAKWSGETRTQVIEAALDRGMAEEQWFREKFDNKVIREVVSTLDRKGVLEAMARVLRFEVDRRRVAALEHRRSQGEPAGGTVAAEGGDA